VVLFPAALPGIRTMIKMRELRPEMDKLNEKYGDDMRAKGVAQMELWRKHGMTPFDQIKGCFPQLATMPVWFALYTTLQTAVELYNIPFLWFPDLSESDPFYILPFIIGGTYFVQQKVMPFQGDAAQRKMMMYLMPAMFTVFMILLPSGLGVYMFTNSVLAITQQQLVERHVRRTQKRGAVTVTEGESTDSKKKGSRPERKNRRRQEAS
jgi:YidC/Oxa1 family membrane protein insertase